MKNCNNSETTEQYEAAIIENYEEDHEISKELEAGAYMNGFSTVPAIDINVNYN